MAYYPIVNNKLFEWFYFDIHTNKGMDIVFTIHTKPFSSVFPITIWEIFIYENGEKVFQYYFVRPQDNLRSIDKQYILKINNDNYLRWEDKTIILSMKDKGITFYMELNNKTNDNESVIYNLLPSPDNKKIFIWKVLCPQGEVKGEIKYNSIKKKITGKGYHDYNCGNINFKKELKFWKWGKFYYDNEMIIFGKIIDKRDREKKLFLKIIDDKILLSDKIQIKENVNEVIFLHTMGINSFRYKNTYEIDKIYFYIPSSIIRFLFFHKIREFLVYLFSKNKYLVPLQRLFSNSKYLRFRISGNTDNQKEFYSFQEEMYF